MNIVIQVSPLSYTGSKDKSMIKFADDELVIDKLIKKLISDFGALSISIAAPDILESRYFDKFIDINVIYGSYDDPLERITETISKLQDDDHFIRIDGINLFYRKEDIIKSYNFAKNNNLDLVKFPDDFPPSYTFDVYKVAVIRKLNFEKIDFKYRVHPKFYIIENKINFKFEYYTFFEKFSDDYLQNARSYMRPVFDFKRLDVNEALNVKHADQISFHYILANRFLQDLTGKLIDLACGEGFGLNIINESNSELDITGIDLDEFAIVNAKNKYPNLKFLVGDALKLDIKSNSIDVVLAFEIIEHVPPLDLLNEIFRILKPGGLLLLSTPQSCIGHIPIVYEHHHEYSRNELKMYVNKLFKIEKFIALKQGSIFIENDEIGTNSFLIAKKII